MIRITANGDPHELPDGATVEALIEHLGLEKAICAAEVNRSVVPHADRSVRTLEDGDTVEIVTLVGGG